MKNKKLIILIASIVLLCLGIVLINQIASAAKTHTNNQVQHSGISSMGMQSQGASPAATPGAPLYFPHQGSAPTGQKAVLPAPTVAPTKGSQPSPTAVPTPPSTPSATPTHPPQPTPSPSPQSGGSTPYRYFAAGTSVSAIQAGASALSKQQVKLLIEKEVDGSWSVIQKDLGFSTKEKAYAFFLGMSSRESTLNAGLETGSGPAHSYGALQAAETAYADANPNYLPETDVPEMTQFSFVPQNFYDPGISIYMGIRHLIHYSKQAKAAGYTGTEWLRHSLIGYNTGFVTGASESWLVQYSDEIGALAGWYLSNGHLYDTQFTYTGASDVDRSQPWGWY